MIAEFPNPNVSDLAIGVRRGCSVDPLRMPLVCRERCREEGGYEDDELRCTVDLLWEFYCSPLTAKDL